MAHSRKVRWRRPAACTRQNRKPPPSTATAEPAEKPAATCGHCISLADAAIAERQGTLRIARQSSTHKQYRQAHALPHTGALHCMQSVSRRPAQHLPAVPSSDAKCNAAAWSPRVEVAEVNVCNPYLHCLAWSLPLSHLGGHTGRQAQRLLGEQVEERLELVHHVQQAPRDDRHPHLQPAVRCWWPHALGLTLHNPGGGSSHLSGMCM